MTKSAHKRPTKNRKTKTLRIRLTPAQAATFEATAEKMTLTLSAFARFAMMELAKETLGDWPP